MPVTTRQQRKRQLEERNETKDDEKQKERNETKDDEKQEEQDKPKEKKPKTMRWYQDGKLHQSATDQDGHVLPAIITKDGTQKWYHKGKLHRTTVDKNGNGLPAVVFPNGDSYWFQHGLLHRDPLGLKPAIVLNSSQENKNKQILEYYIHGVKQYRPSVTPE